MENSNVPKAEKKLTAGKLKEILASVPDDAIVSVEASDTGEAEEVYLTTDGERTGVYITEELSDPLAGSLFRYNKTVTQLYCAWKEAGIAPPAQTGEDAAV